MGNGVGDTNLVDKDGALVGLITSATVGSLIGLPVEDRVGDGI